MPAYGFAGGQVANSVLIQKLCAYNVIKEKLCLSQEFCTHIQDKINSPEKIKAGSMEETDLPFRSAKKHMQEHMLWELKM